MAPLTYEENNIYKKRKVFYIFKKEFSPDDDNKIYHKVRDHCYYTEKYKRAVHKTEDIKIKRNSCSIS